jgi:hypothetical protein
MSRDRRDDKNLVFREGYRNRCEDTERKMLVLRMRCEIETQREEIQTRIKMRKGIQQMKRLKDARRVEQGNEWVLKKIGVMVLLIRVCGYLVLSKGVTRV